MKKKLIVLFTLIAASFTTKAQVTISPGIRGGLNLSTLTNIENNQFKSDFYVGGLVAIKFNKYFTLQPELSYSRQGTKGTYLDFSTTGNNYQDIKTTYELNYISADAVAKFNIKGSGFHLLAGPFMDIKTDDNFTFSGSLINFDIGIITGVGYSLPNGLAFEARFKQGLMDIYGFNYTEDNNGNGNYDEVILNQLFQFGMSYTFKMK